jgi:hypothetical protein
VGSSLVAAGSGWQPLYLKGSVYLTSGYEGAPFGLSIVTSAVAGPLNLGRVVIRARIDTDPQTAALEITTSPLPQILLGVPLRIQRVSLLIDRPHFIVNPTNCDEQQITATITGVQGASSEVSDPFGLGDCANLPFQPKLQASTGGHTSFTNGASLYMKLTFPKAEQSSQANLARIKIALPKQLPSRLTTLQDACPRGTFAANPALCPDGSIVGLATAHTPILPGQLTGPVYFVTHGPEAVPSPVVILQGDGVRLDLQGATAISRSGMATVTFGSIPDLPIDDLQLYLSAGPHSLLSTDTNLCAFTKTVTVKRRVTHRVHGRIVHHTIEVHERTLPSLPMATEFAAHNGATLHQTTRIAVTGCAASKVKATRRR